MKRNKAMAKCITKCIKPHKKISARQNNILKLIKPYNASILPFLNFEALHTIGEFLYNIIHENVKLPNKIRENAKCIVHKHRPFMKLLTTNKTPVLMMKKKLNTHPQIGKGIADLITAVAPGLLRRGTSTRSNIDYQLLDNEDHAPLSDRIANDEWKKQKQELIAKKQQLLQSLAEKEELLELMDQREIELQNR